MAEPIEIMARAIQEAPFYRPDRPTWDVADSFARDMRLCEAKLAIKALDEAGYAIVPKEPNAFMFAAVPIGNPSDGEIYRAMTEAGRVKP